MNNLMPSPRGSANPNNASKRLPSLNSLQSLPSQSQPSYPPACTHPTSR